VHYTTSCNTQFSVPEHGEGQHPKHVELMGIIKKPLFLHLVGIYIIFINDAWSNQYQIPYVGLSLAIVRHFRKGSEKNTTRHIMPICFHGKNGSYYKDFSENFNCRVLVKIVNQIHVWLK
jgi:hypothetical protein